LSLSLCPLCDLCVSVVQIHPERLVALQCEGFEQLSEILSDEHDLQDCNEQAAESTPLCLFSKASAFLCPVRSNPRLAELFFQNPRSGRLDTFSPGAS
jgi:hypothetical protein